MYIILLNKISVRKNVSIQKVKCTWYMLFCFIISCFNDNNHLC